MSNLTQYLRIDSISDVLCPPITTTLESIYEAGKSSKEHLMTLPVSDVVRQTLGDAKTYLNQHGVAELLETYKGKGYDCIRDTPLLNETFSRVTSTLASVPYEPLPFCHWFQTRAIDASDNVEHLLKNPSSVTQMPYDQLLSTFITYFTVLVIISIILRITYFMLGIYFRSSRAKQQSLYLLDRALFTEFRKDWFVTHEEWAEACVKGFGATRESVDFTLRVAANSGITKKTCLPPHLFTRPPRKDMEKAREESEWLMFDVVEQLLKKNKLKPTQIDVLVVNCSLFNPTPSHCSMIINKFKMREDIICYALHGMGCSASAIAVNSCQDALFQHPDPNAIGIVISFENLTQNIYAGDDKSMLVTQALFRMGAAGMLLSKSPRVHGIRAKYKLDALIRTHIGRDDEAYRSVFQTVDADMKVGVSLSKAVPKIAAKALTKNMTLLGKKFLPTTAIIGYIIRLIKYKMCGGEAKPVPNFLSCFNQVCIHAGGRGVIDSIEKNLSLPKHITEPSRYVLDNYGNQSSASIWYTFDIVDKKCRRGDRVWQIAFGSGFKCNSMVWTKL